MNKTPQTTELPKVLNVNYGYIIVGAALVDTILGMTFASGLVVCLNIVFCVILTALCMLCLMADCDERLKTALDNMYKNPLTVTRSQISFFTPKKLLIYGASILVFFLGFKFMAVSTILFMLLAMCLFRDYVQRGYAKIQD